MSARALALFLAMGGCSLVIDVGASRTREGTEALCRDGIDNDEDGLTDCQDWKCLSTRACCTLPEIILSDDFNGPSCAGCAADPAGCAADPTRWQPWGQPSPIVCDGTLSPDKRQQCYDVGVLSQAALSLRPGLLVTVEIVGRPEIAGRLEVALTAQDRVQGGITPCDSTITGVNALLAVRQARSINGYQLIASIGDREVGRSPEVLDGDSLHRLVLSAQPDRRVHFLLDDKEYAATPADEPLPADATTVRLALSGRGSSARFASVRVIDGDRCESPAAWTLKGDSPMLAASSNPAEDWESYQVFQPSVTRAPNDRVLLYYTACRANAVSGGCDRTLAAGRVVSQSGGPFLADSKPAHALGFLSNATEAEGDGGLLRIDPPQDTFLGFITLLDATPPVRQTIRSTVAGTGSSTGMTSAALAGSTHAGDWDDGGVCCATAVQREGRILLWYTGRRAGDPVTRIGLATSTDGGVNFTKHSGNPVLVEGGPGAFDGRGLTDAEVIYDPTRHLYRMWYLGHASFSADSIGYAVSTDGTTWHKSPDGQPVIDGPSIGLEALGSPAVLLEEDRIRLWLHGRQAGQVPLAIYELENRGAGQ